MTRTSPAWLLLALACAQEPAPPKPSASAEPTPAPAGVRVEGLRKLALVVPAGGHPADDEVRQLQAALGKNAKKEDHWVLLGRAWVKKARQSSDPGYYANANAAADVALDLRPDYPLALDLKAMALMNDHRFAEARDLAQRSLAKDPDDMMALGTLSDAYLELGEFELASQTVQRMIDFKPCLPSYIRASYLRWLAGDVAAAKRAARSAIDAGQDQKDPEPLAWVLTEAAKIFAHEGDYEGAEAGFDRAIATYPNYPPALAGKARMRLALGRPVEAAALAERSYQAAPLAETAWLWGDAERAAGNTAGAELAYGKLVRLGRQGEKRALAAFFAAEDRDLTEALKLVEAELAHRRDVYTLDAHAWVLYRLGRYAEAKAASDRALAHGTADALLLFHAGAIRVALGEKAAGEALIERALRLSPKFSPAGAAEAERLLADKQPKRG